MHFYFSRCLKVDGSNTGMVVGNSAEIWSFISNAGGFSLNEASLIWSNYSIMPFVMSLKSHLDLSGKKSNTGLSSRSCIIISQYGSLVERLFPHSTLHLQYCLSEANVRNSCLTSCRRSMNTGLRESHSRVIACLYLPGWLIEIRSTNVELVKNENAWYPNHRAND
jgi:hypothetical protein